MKGSVVRRIALFTFCCALVFPILAIGQGSLTPPGAPGPTMKTLQQVEPRFMVTNAPVTLSAAGSYYLTTNLFGTVTISGNDITLDLMGFRIQPSSGNGITVSSNLRNLQIANGSLVGGTYGVDGGPMQNNQTCRLYGLRVVGTQTAGMRLEVGYSVEDCLISSNRTDGIVIPSGAVGVLDCAIVGNGGIGLKANGGTGIIGNHLAGNGTGIELNTGGSHLEENRVDGNATNYDILAPGNRLNLVISELPESLDYPCSVRLAGTLKATGSSNGIEVNSDNVTIDMAGHALIGAGQEMANAHGIYMADKYHNLRVHNGKLVGWTGSEQGGGYDPSGICALGTGVIIQNVQAYSNENGIVAGMESVIKDCTSHRNGKHGIWVNLDSTVENCSANYNGADGFTMANYSTVNHCVANENTNGFGFNASASALSHCSAAGNDAGFDLSDGCTLSESAANGNLGDGIILAYGCRVSDSVARGNVQSGLASGGMFIAGNGNRVERNHLSGNLSDGIHLQGLDNHVDGNSCVNNVAVGLQVIGTGNVVVRNTARGNSGGNYAIIAGNTDAAVLAPGAAFPATGAPWANISY